ncbi:MAG: HEAT repeat domain-containing protein [Verrucomicrobia bacterium]|nr:HEAT repeat domain-containing protein [Verrucomicrobiota bacterium]
MKRIRSTLTNRGNISSIESAKFYSLVIGIMLLNTASPILGQNVEAPKNQIPPVQLSPRAQVFIEKGWSDASFTEGIAIIVNRTENWESRAVAMEMLHANRRKLNPDQMSHLLAEATTIAKDSKEDEALSTVAIHTMGNVALTMQELGQISATEAKKEFRFFMDSATNSQRAAYFRASAINTLGILKVAEATALLRDMLDERVSMNVPDLSRPACLSLMRIDGEQAAPTLAQVLRKTSDASVFGTAAFALGKIKNAESMIALVESLERFPESGSCDAALVGMEEVITDVLKNPEDPNLGYAIRATRHLWREGQRERYFPLLRQILITASGVMRKASLDRLLEGASSLEFQQEKQELVPILEAISDQSELGEYQERIRLRLSATLLTPAAGNTVPVPPALKGKLLE